MKQIAASIVISAACVNVAVAQDFPTILSKAMEKNGCVMSEDAMSAVLKRAGADTWTINQVIVNMGEAARFSYDSEKGTYTLRGTKRCK